MRIPRVLPLALVLFLLPIGATQAQVPPPAERLTFDQAVERALSNHPTLASAAAGILRAEAVLQQTTSFTRPSLDATLTTSVVDPVQEFNGSSITPRTQLLTTVGVAVPVLTPVLWAQRNQARDQVSVAEYTRDDARRAVAVAAAQAYLQLITAHRVQELSERARDTAQAHYEYARQRFEGGVGSRLNMLRAQQELSVDETRVEEARLNVRRSQEALGVLVAGEGPVDVAGEPAFDLPSGEAAPGADGWLDAREDVQLVAARQAAAERVVRDSRLDYLPSVTGLFDPQFLTPSGLFAPTRSWSARLLFQVPIFDAGERRGLARQRVAELDRVRAERDQVERQARSEIRVAHEAVTSTERALASARAAAEQAAEVLRITDAAFRAGATTNIEVIDAQRRARDAETEAAIAEDEMRRARLELLVAIGRFPQ